LQQSNITREHLLASHGGEGNGQATVSSSDGEPWCGDHQPMQYGVAALPLASHGGEGMENGSHAHCKAEDLRKDGTDATPIGGKILMALSSSTSKVVGQLPQFKGSSSSTALRWLTTVLVPKSRVVGQPLPPCSPVCRRKVIPLQAYEPMWRPSGFDVVCSLHCAEGFRSIENKKFSYGSEQESQDLI
jgi:hypothetical protein